MQASPVTPEEAKVFDNRTNLRKALEILKKDHTDLVKKEQESVLSGEVYAPSEDVLEIENAIAMIERDLMMGALNRAQKAIRDSMDQQKADLVNKVIAEDQTQVDAPNASQQDLLGEVVTNLPD